MPPLSERSLANHQEMPTGSAEQAKAAALGESREHLRQWQMRNDPDFQSLQQSLDEARVLRTKTPLPRGWRNLQLNAEIAPILNHLALAKIYDPDNDDQPEQTEAELLRGQQPTANISLLAYLSNHGAFVTRNNPYSPARPIEIKMGEHTFEACDELGKVRFELGVSTREALTTNAVLQTASTYAQAYALRQARQSANPRRRSEIPSLNIDSNEPIVENWIENKKGENYNVTITCGRHRIKAQILPAKNAGLPSLFIPEGHFVLSDVGFSSGIGPKMLQLLIKGAKERGARRLEMVIEKNAILCTLDAVIGAYNISYYEPCSFDTSYRNVLSRTSAEERGRFTIVIDLTKVNTGGW